MEKYYNTFIIKISDGVSEEPRGHIQHIATQAQKYFEGYEEMNRFISTHLKPPDNGFAESK